jgi:tetratricopeptide (TPR) repeat protein
MTTSAIEDRIAALWNRAVDLEMQGQSQAMLECWKEVQRFDEQHKVLDDPERARLSLFLGTAYAANRQYQEASDQYAQAAQLYLQMAHFDESMVQWVEETLKKWDAAQSAAPSIRVDEKLYREFRARVPSEQVRSRMRKPHDRITVQARPGRWQINIEDEGKTLTFLGETFEEALAKARPGSRSYLTFDEWGPDTTILPPFPG